VHLVPSWGLHEAAPTMATPSMPTCLSVTVTDEVGSLVPQPWRAVGPVSPGMGLASERVAAEERRMRREDFMVWLGMGGRFWLKCEWILAEFYELGL